MKTWRWARAGNSAAHVQGRRHPRNATALPVALPAAGGRMRREAAAGLPPAVLAETREAFRYALVELMLCVVEAWERSTGLRRLELAERSRIWRITVDDGRLRARAMERYLALSKLPRQPRWREVVRSAYYVLNECALEPRVRADLQRRVDMVLAYHWNQALTQD